MRVRVLPVIGVAALAALAIACGGTSSTSGGGTGSGAKAAATPAAKIGAPVRDGKFEFTVTAVKCGIAKIGDSVLNKTAQGQFCEVTLTVKNIGKEQQTFDGSNQQAFDAAGTKYSNDGTAELYANSASQTFLEAINPGNQVSGIVVFDVPKTTKLTRLELHDSAFSGGVSVDISV